MSLKSDLKCAMSIDLCAICSQCDRGNHFTLLSAARSNFLKQHISVDKIIVHCYAGQSRSVAVAQVIAEVFDVVIEVNNRPSPNRHVYKTLKNEFDCEKEV